MQILVYTSDFSVFINWLSKIMIKSNANSRLHNTSMLYKQTASSRHDVFWIKGHLSVKSVNIVAIFYLYKGKIQFLSSLLSNGRFFLLLSC